MVDGHDFEAWAASLYGAPIVSAPAAAGVPGATPGELAVCGWASDAEAAVGEFNRAVDEQAHMKKAKLRDTEGPSAKKARPASNRLPLYNLRQVMLWVQECSTKNQEHERAKICRLLVEIYMQLLPKLDTRPTAACNCRLCMAYKERVRSEALNLGWSVVQSANRLHPYCPHLGEDHLLQD